MKNTNSQFNYKFTRFIYLIKTILLIYSIHIEFNLVFPYLSHKNITIA